MIPLPSYQLIPFLAWLHGRGVRLPMQQANSAERRELALRFLEHGGDWRFPSLVAVMEIFQDCPVIREPDVEARMDHFAGCGFCIEQIAEHDRHGQRGYFGGRRLYPWQGQNQESLPPLLRGFLEWARGSELDSLPRHRDEISPSRMR